MSRIIDSLVTDRLVLRETASADARRATVQITARGRDVAISAVPAIGEPLRRAFAGLDRDTFAALDKILRALVLSFDRAIEHDRSVA
jgi:DNA-binding MarR family transcriptional regulator